MNLFAYKKFFYLIIINVVLIILYIFYNNYYYDNKNVMRVSLSVYFEIRDNASIGNYDYIDNSLNAFQSVTKPIVNFYDDQDYYVHLLEYMMLTMSWREMMLMKSWRKT